MYALRRGLVLACMIVLLHDLPPHSLALLTVGGAGCLGFTTCDVALPHSWLSPLLRRSLSFLPPSQFD
eukprot:15449023-Alexandrium_andersonii.AAC.1